MKRTLTADYVRRIGRPIRDGSGRITGYQMPGGLYGVFEHPPLGRALAGRRATAGGRGHRASASEQAHAERVALCHRAWLLRIRDGLTIREIAAVVGRSPAVVHRWLYAVPACGGGPDRDPTIRLGTEIKAWNERLTSRGRDDEAGDATLDRAICNESRRAGRPGRGHGGRGPRRRQAARDRPTGACRTALPDARGRYRGGEGP